MEAPWTRLAQCPIYADRYAIGFLFVGQWNRKRLETTNKRQKKRPSESWLQQGSLGLEETGATMMIRCNRTVCLVSFLYLFRLGVKRKTHRLAQNVMNFFFAFLNGGFP